ncbi:MAG: hypothetical protein SNJ67_11960 [Chloracidobacterium sp.]
MSESTTLPPVTERGFTNLMITGFVYPMTALPVTPLLGIYRSGKETYRFLESTPFGSNDLVRLAVTVLATPFVALVMLWPFGIIEGTELISNQVARLGLDKAVENTIHGVADSVFGTIGSLLPKE